MRNQFAGSCYRCGLTVAAGTGYFEKRRDAKGFRVQHAYSGSNGGITCETAKKTALHEAYKALESEIRNGW
jgi:hypothetical protein